MKTFRDLRVASLIGRELSKLFLKKIDFDGVFVTITAVEVSTDLLQAKVKLGIIPFEKGPEVFNLLEERRRELQHLLLKRINIKPMPRIKFVMATPDLAQRED